MTKAIRKTGLGLIAGALLAGQAVAADPIRIGIVGPVTGPAATTGLTVQAAWQLVADQYNDKGGIEIGGEKRMIELVPGDSQSKTSVGVSAAQRLLVRDGVDILVGDTLHSDITLGIMEVTAAYPNTLLYVPLPTSTSIGNRVRDEPEKYGNVWKWDADNTAYGASISDFMLNAEGRDFPNKTFAIVAEQADYAATIAEEVQAHLADTDWEMVAYENAPIGNTDWYAQISKVKSLSPDVVISIFTTANSGLAYVRQANEQKAEYEDIGTYYPGLPAFMEGIGEAGNGLIYFSGSFDKASERGGKFAELMTRNGISASTDAVLGYCSAGVLFEAIERAGALDATSIGEAFLGTDNDTCANYQRIVFDPVRHAPKLGPDYSFITGSQLYNSGTESFVFYPPRAATRALDDFPAE